MALTAEEIRIFGEQGFLGPFPVCGEEEMAEIREPLDAVVAEGEGRWNQRHLDSRAVYELCAKPALLDRIGSLLGPDLALWSTRFRVKYAATKEIPWHQDVIYWQLDPLVNVSAWLAIDDVDHENSCVQLIPGSHRETIPHAPSQGDVHHDFTLVADPAYYREETAVSMVMRAGECFLFSERALHRSSANASVRRRAALTIRVTTPRVKVRTPGHDRLILLRGRDDYGYNTLAPPPAEDR